MKGTLGDRPMIRAIEDERSKLIMERSAFLEDEGRRRRDKRAEKRKVEMLITIVFCAVAVSYIAHAVGAGQSAPPLPFVCIPLPVS